MTHFRFFHSVVAVSILFMSFSNRTHAKEFRILVLPSGGAMGAIEATLLAEVERATGQPIYKLFDEIWASSIGSAIAALLTTPKTDGKGRSVSEEPMAAHEVAGFLEDTFSSYYKAYRIRGRLRDRLMNSIEMKDTKIPIRVLSAEVTEWSRFGLPTATLAREYCPEQHGKASVASVVCGSCTVYPVFPWTEKVALGENKVVHCVDAGSEVCSECSMNPIWQFFYSFSERMIEGDTLSLFFVSNGWIRLESHWQGLVEANLTNKLGREIPTQVFNIDVDLSPAFKEWGERSCVGGLIDRKCRSSYIKMNIASMGAMPVSILKNLAVQVAENSEVFKEMVEYLKAPSPTSLD